jgi:hypothetical protein
MSKAPDLHRRRFAVLQRPALSLPRWDVSIFRGVKNVALPVAVSVFPTRSTQCEKVWPIMGRKCWTIKCLPSLLEHPFRRSQRGQRSLLHSASYVPSDERSRESAQAVRSAAVDRDEPEAGPT